MSIAKPAGNFLARDFTASIVVFLVAMPLCLGIAIASGMPPEKGLVTGIIGGIVVGAMAGSPLQVSGPAAGLAVIVFELVRDQGLSALGPILILAGAIQVVAGILKLGGWFRAISPAVVHGMLAGIGVLIVVSQFHVLFDAKPMSSGLDNLAAMPARLMGLDPANITAPELAIVVALMTIGIMLAWDKFRPAALKLVPSALLGVVAATLVVYFAGLNVARVDVPQSIASAISLPDASVFAKWLDPSILLSALAIAFIASAETLLSAAAVDKMHDGVRTDYNKELRAQGVGNLLCGAAGALPMTGVIVRSSANVQAGAVTRLSAMLHGVWILGFVALLPWLLREIPMAALGAVLVVTGWKLVNLGHVRDLFRHHGALPALIWAATLIVVVASDLLTGVLVGIGLSLIEVIPHVRRLKLGIERDESENGVAIRLSGAATFVQLPKLNDALDGVPKGKAVVIDGTQLAAMDHTCAELMRDWVNRQRTVEQDVSVLGGSSSLARLAA